MKAFTGEVSSNKRLAMKLKSLCDAFNIQYMQKNEEDSIEMIRDLVFFKRCKLENPEYLSGFSSFPLGPYKFLSL
jgi:hypothetical protein